jgi:hypothetical protein
MAGWPVRARAAARTRRRLVGSAAAGVAPGNFISTRLNRSSGAWQLNAKNLASGKPMAHHNKTRCGCRSYNLPLATGNGGQELDGELVGVRVMDRRNEAPGCVGLFVIFAC